MTRHLAIDLPLAIDLDGLADLVAQPETAILALMVAGLALALTVLVLVRTPAAPVIHKRVGR